MAAEVYASTTAPNPRSPFCLFPSEHLEKQRFILKGVEVKTCPHHSAVFPPAVKSTEAATQPPCD